MTEPLDRYPRRLLTVQEVSEIIGVSESTIRRWINKEVLRAIKIGRIVRVTPEEVDRFCGR